MWQESTDMTILQYAFNPSTGAITGPAPQAPAIAIVDSGVQARADFGSRLVASVNMGSLCAPMASGDDEGHGTMVAGVAAGASVNYPGGAKNAPIVSIRTADASGQSLESDVVAAADWIDAHAKQYNIRVANFSLATADTTRIRVDPLDKAVERLWLDGIVVIAAAGAVQLLRRHPSFRPDQVKGAIMLSSNCLPSVNGFSGGVGEVDGGIAASLDGAPNPNEGLYQFVSKDPLTAKSVFNAASWASYLSSGASWAQASWAEASWGEASWSTASWAEASWNEASWVASVNGQMTTLASYSESTFK